MLGFNYDKIEEMRNLISSTFQKKNCFILLFAVLFFIACKSSRISIQTDKIIFVADSSLFKKSKIYSNTTDRIDFGYYSNNFLEILQFHFTDNNKVTISSKSPVTFMEFSVSGSNIAYPGDSIVVKKDSNGRVIYTSAVVSRNNEFICNRILDDKATELRKELYEVSFSDTLKFAPVYREAELKRIDSIYYSKLILLLDSLSQSFSISSQYFLEKRTKYTANLNLGLSLFYDTVSNIYRYRTTSIENGGMKKMIKKLKIKPSDFSGFVFSINTLFECLLDNHNIKRKINTSENFIAQFNLISSSFYKGIIKDYLLSKIFSETLAQRINVPSKYIKKYLRICRTKSYRSEVIKKIEQIKSVEGFEISTLNNNYIVGLSLTPKIKFEELLQNNIGKIIIFDFWASWCLPCREEIPHIKKLKDIYRDSPIEFIYLSLDKNISHWLNSCKMEGINNCNSYIISNIEKFEWIKKYSITSIPRYIIVGKDGKIISTEAPYPSDPQLKILIDKNL